MTIENTLNERGARYGIFMNHAEIAQGIQAVYHKSPNWPTLDYDMRQALVTISDKIARILNGDPYYSDNWHDLQGYAKLVEDRLVELERQAEDEANQPFVPSHYNPEVVNKMFEEYRRLVGVEPVDHATVAMSKLQNLIESKIGS